MLPQPCVVFLIALKGGPTCGHRPLIARRTQPHVSFIKPPLRCLCGYGGDQGLGQARIVGPRGQGPRPVRLLHVKRVIDHDQVQIGFRRQKPCPKAAHAKDHSPPPRWRAMTPSKVRLHLGPKRRQGRARQIGILPARFLGRGQAAQVMDAHPKMPFLGPDTDGIQLGLVILFHSQPLPRIVLQRLASGPWREKAAPDHRIKDGGIAREILRQRRRRAHNINQQVHKCRVCLEKREKLHTRRQAREKAIKRGQSLCRFCGLFQARQQHRFDPIKERRATRTAQGRIAAPPGLHGAVHRNRRGRRLGGKEPFGLAVHLGKPVLQLGLQTVAFGAHHRCQTLKPLVIGWQVVGLRVPHHLHAVLDRAGKAVVVRQLCRQVILDPPFLCQLLQSGHRAPHPQVGIAPPCNQLPGLGEKLDLANAAASKFHIVPGQGNRPTGALVRPDGKTHVVGILHSRKIKMSPPNKGAQILQKPLTRCDIAGAWPRLDIGGPLPCAPQPLIVPLCRAHRHDHRCNRRVRAQPQVGPKHIALAGDIAQRGAHVLHCLDTGPPDGRKIIGVMPRFIEKTDQIDVGGIVQLKRAHLAHGQHKQTDIAVGQLAPLDLLREPGGQRRLTGHVSQLRQRAGHVF
mmetsp:Transcript_23431/g.41164  ORF Transcript_23431/g.41164 Transcript_23431/m.41164 type:complete len:627 (-) Transcript_23431:312-2192(-)